jgi:enoyl-CoA hydratase
MPVTYDVEGRVGVVGFDDGKANAFTHSALQDIARALDRAEADPEVGAVVLAGRPGRFSAGFDLAAMTESAESMRSLVKAGGIFVARLLLTPMPLVAACTGHALAAGALVLLAADYRVGVEGEFRVGLNEVSIGLALPRWAVELARYRIPPSQLDDSTILGQTWTPQQSVARGFLDRVVAADQLMSSAMEIASGYSGLKREAVSGTKSRMRGELASKMLEGIDADLELLSPPEPPSR